MLGCIPTLGIMSKAEKQEYRQKKRCERKYNRYKKHCPENIHIDTLRVPISVAVDSQGIAKAFNTYKNEALIDSIRTGFKGFIDSLSLGNDSLARVLLNRTSSTILKFSRNARCIEDTISFDTTVIIMIDDQTISVRLTIGATQPNPQTITPFVYVPPQDLSTTKEVVTETPCPPEFTVKEWLYRSWSTIMWVALIGLIVYLLYRLFRNVIKKIIQ